MGIVKNYEDIRKCSVIIVGIGGIGSVRTLRMKSQ